MGAGTRTVLIWFNNDEERLTFAVNPGSMTFSRPQASREFVTVGGEHIHVAAGRGLMSVGISTFLPGEGSRFYRGIHPLSALGMLKRWQESGRPVRLIISDTDINDAFLITELKQGISEGDEDVQVGLTLKEYKFVKLEGAAVVSDSGVSQLASRADERQVPRSHTVQKGETLWGIATRYYGDGTKWKELADRNGVADPRQLPIGKVLSL